MVSAKLDYFYTWKVVDEEAFKFACTKWEELSGEPIDTYTIEPNVGSNRACSCQAYKRECKHLVQLEEARYRGYDLWAWRWDAKGGWVKLDDFRPIEEF